MLRTGLLLMLAASTLPAQSTRVPNLMPMPSSIQAGTGALDIGSGFGIATDPSSPRNPRLDRAIDRMRLRISALTSAPGRIGSQPRVLVRVRSASRPVQSLGEDESYRVVVNDRQALISAPNELGAMHGLETLYQLIAKAPQGWQIPAVTIEDQPRFAWRGLHMDVSRHFMPLEVIRRNLDGMAAVKLNVFHWHLSDDQGFRVESKVFPKLQELGSDGLFYTQDQIRGIIEYAGDRGIRVVPEFDIPGHATSWLVGYPELASAPGPYEILRTWGISIPALDPAKPEVYTFLDRFIGEMASLFPDAYFHIGGDEVNGKQWSANTTDISAFMKLHNIATNHDLQAYFNQQLEKIVTKYGKKMEGWDEILNPALPKNIVIQSWRGAKSLADAAHQGYQGILSSGYYLDHIETSSKLYLVDPFGDKADSLTKEEKERILGGEVCMWAEYVSLETVDSRIWPRTAAIAERYWSPAGTRDVADMYRRLDAIDTELDALGLKHNSNYLPMLQRLAGSSNIDALKILADVLSPGDLGQRHRAKSDYTQQTPLDRLVDAARPDPPVARRFNAMVERYVANPQDTTIRAEISQWLTLWAANDAKLQPLIAQRQNLHDAAAPSAALSRIANLVLTNNKTAPEFQTALKPIGEVNLAVAPALLKLAPVWSR